MTKTRFEFSQSDNIFFLHIQMIVMFQQLGAASSNRSYHFHIYPYTHLSLHWLSNDWVPAHADGKALHFQKWKVSITFDISVHKYIEIKGSVCGH